jgi:hypothetical protein
VRKRIAIATAILLVAAGFVVPASGGSHHVLVGVYDDAQVLGNPGKTFPLLHSLKVQVLRVSLTWGSGPFAVSRKKPKHPRDPGDAAYNWGTFDRAVEQAAKYKIKILFGIGGTPAWANGGRSPNRAPSAKYYSYLSDFAYAAATRYSGEYKRRRDGKVLAKVRLWLAWNEPNNPVFLYPQYARVHKKWVIQSAADYAKICTAIYDGVHGTRLNGEQVGCGATDPRGNDNPRSSRPTVDPLVFLSALKRAGLRRFDAYTHHPYYGTPRQSPSARPEPKTVRMGNIGALTKLLGRLYGNKHLWITEYGYQTKPPDRVFGVSWTNQAKYLAQAYSLARRNPRIDMMIWFLVRDESRLSGWQSGFITAAGKKKPSFKTFQRLPH